MNKDRLAQMAESIGNTALVDLSNYISHDCKLFAKCEFENPTGSHYDRVYLEIFKELEDSGKIQRGKTHLVEVSSGSADASFAWFCRELGYEATLIIPQGLLPTSTKYIKSQNTDMNIIVSDQPGYVSGAIRTMQKYLIMNKSAVRNGDMVCLDHSRNPITLNGSQRIAEEAVQELKARGQNIDYFIAARGNGTTIVGPGPVLKSVWPHMKTILFEEAIEKKQSPQALFGAAGDRVSLPFLEDPQYGFSHFSGYTISLNQKQIQEALALNETGLNLGNTSLAALWVARQQAAQMPGSSMFIILYDTGVKYGRQIILQPKSADSHLSL